MKPKSSMRSASSSTSARTRDKVSDPVSIRSSNLGVSTRISRRPDHATPPGSTNTALSPICARSYGYQVRGFPLGSA